jgi:hypothetical protein
LVSASELRKTETGMACLDIEGEAVNWLKLDPIDRETQRELEAFFSSGGGTVGDLVRHVAKRFGIGSSAAAQRIARYALCVCARSSLDIQNSSEETVSEGVYFEAAHLLVQLDERDVVAAIQSKEDGALLAARVMWRLAATIEDISPEEGPYGRLDPTFK